jgi:FkbM family methyltransferase
MYDAVYEPHVFRALMDRMKPGACFLDIGANIGVFSVHAAKAGARVIAIEALGSNAKLLLENARRNSADVELHPLAASDRHGYVGLVLGESLNAAVGDAAATEVVAAAPVDALIGDRHIDVIKIDVEGHEYRAMLGAFRLLGRCRPVVFTEYSPVMQHRSSGVEGSEYLELFLSLGYRLWLLGDSPSLIKPEQADDIWRSTGASHIDLMLTV